MPRRAAPPPQFDGRGAQQVLDAAADRAASLRRAHRAASCPANCPCQRLLEPVCIALSSTAVMLPEEEGSACPGSGSGLIRVMGCGSAPAPHPIPPPRRRHEAKRLQATDRTEPSIKPACGSDTNTSGLFKIKPLDLGLVAW